MAIIVKLSVVFVRSLFGCLIFSWMPIAASECTDRLDSVCGLSGVIRSQHLVTNLPQSVTVTCSGSAQLSGWSLSPNGGENVTTFDTSSDKYTVNTNSLTINNVNSSDEGLYRCVYGSGASTRERCIIVYGVAVFDSCRLGVSSGCTGNPTPISVTAGEDILFDAAVVHTTGGSCGFLQDISSVALYNTSTLQSVTDELLLRCPLSSNDPCSGNGVSLDRGERPGYDFVFTLSNANASAAGRYKVVVERFDAHSSSLVTSLTKEFQVEVLPSPTGIPITTTDSFPSSHPTTTDQPAVSEANTAPNNGTLVAAVVVVMVMVSIALLSVILIAVIIVYYKRQGGWSKDEKKEKENGSVEPSASSPPPVYQELRPPHHSSELTAQEQNLRNQTEFMHIPHPAPGFVIMLPQEGLPPAANGTDTVGQPFPDPAHQHDHVAALPNTAKRQRIPAPLKSRESRIESDFDLPDLSLNKHLNSTHHFL